MKLVLVYSALAAIATAVNIGAQHLSTRLYGGPGTVICSMIVGTGVALAVKYWLDKRYIFQFQARDARHDATLFSLYALMGLATTALFWIVELGFDHVFARRSMRDVGAVIGLALGYAIKYRLDKRFVFRRDAPRSP